MINTTTSSTSSGNNNTPDTLQTDLSAPFGVGFTSSSDITAITESGNVVTASLSSPLNGAVVGGAVQISGVGVSGYNGTFTISSINGNAIQYADSASALAASSGGTASAVEPPPQNPVFMLTAQ